MGADEMHSTFNHVDHAAGPYTGEMANDVGSVAAVTLMEAEAAAPGYTAVPGHANGSVLVPMPSLSSALLPQPSNTDHNGDVPLSTSICGGNAVGVPMSFSGSAVSSHVLAGSSFDPH